MSLTPDGSKQAAGLDRIGKAILIKSQLVPFALVLAIEPQTFRAQAAHQINRRLPVDRWPLELGRPRC